MNLALFVVVALLLGATQSSLWFQTLGSFPAPQLWLLVIVYLCIQRVPLQGILMMYLMSIIFSGFTAVPFGLLLLLNLLLWLGLSMFKARIFWPGPTFYALMCAATAFVMPILHISLTWLIEKTPVTRISFFALLVSPLLTFLLAFPLYEVMAWIDRITNKELPAESGGGQEA